MTDRLTKKGKGCLRLVAVGVWEAMCYPTLSQPHSSTPTPIQQPQCCGLVTDPTLLLIDEPTSGLDGYAALVVMRLLKAFTQKVLAKKWEFCGVAGWFAFAVG
jgi:ABC-type histidine transport system ATPase subunit